MKKKIVIIAITQISLVVYACAPSTTKWAVVKLGKINGKAKSEWNRRKVDFQKQSKYRNDGEYIDTDTRIIVITLLYSAFA